MRLASATRAPDTDVKQAETLGSTSRIMRNRHVADTIELDQSLRTARAIYVVCSALFVPGALIAFPLTLSGCAVLLSTLLGETVGDPEQAFFDVILGIIAIGLAYVVVSQAVEASKRIRTLADDPAAPVRPMYVPEFLKRL